MNLKCFLIIKLCRCALYYTALQDVVVQVSKREGRASSACGRGSLPTTPVYGPMQCSLRIPRADVVFVPAGTVVDRSDSNQYNNYLALFRVCKH